MSSGQYHREIDGLRAISVLVIILFHLKVEAFAGGFVGVDVFFVVSGFLITRIIVGGLNEGSFTFRDFYIRRTTRILPALVVTVIAVLAVAAYLQLPDALVHTAREGLFALLSLSNFYYWSEADYWARAAENYPLLHTWSLGVEEQFYLVYPLLLFVSHRIAGMRGVVVLLVVVVVAGTAASEYTLHVDRTAAFYFTPLRFYEFALGGLATLLVARSEGPLLPPVAAGLATVLGVGLILFASLTFSGWHPLPGALMLVPVGGAVLILLAGSSAGARLLLINPLMAWIGRISYSLYLVHWPIVVFYRYRTGPTLTPLEQVVLVVTMLLAAQALNTLVEQRFRLSQGGATTRAGRPAGAVLRGILAAMLVTGGVAGVLVAQDGWPGRMPPGALELMAINPRQDMLAKRDYLERECLPAGKIFCGERRDDRRNIWLAADSRGLDIYQALRTAYPEANVMVSWAMGCQPLLGGASRSQFFPDCPEFNRARMATVLAAPPEDIVFLALDFSSWRERRIIETVGELRAAGKTVFVLGPFRITGERDPIEITIERLRFGDPVERHLVDEPFARDDRLNAEITALGATFVSNRDFFLRDGGYSFSDPATGQLLTYDGVHLNVYGAQRFGTYLARRYPLP